MPKVLSEVEVERYKRDGYHFPVDIFSADENARHYAQLLALEAREGGAIKRATNQKPHLLLPWLTDIARHPKILDAVEDIIGPNILCWASGFFMKNPNDNAYVSWHQDATYWGLSSPDVITAWVAFTPSTPASGCMRVDPGTHQRQLEHADTFDQNNLLTRGQEVRAQVDERGAVDVVLQPGQISLHHVLLVHGSGPNRSDHRRIGYAIRYIAPHVKQLAPMRDGAMLMRGVDTHGYFDLEAPPESDFHPAAVARHAAAMERYVKILYAGAKKMRDQNETITPARPGAGA
jgi:non-haem Fe2+, alpha-ketoglutarate-dependent halogenase